MNKFNQLPSEIKTLLAEKAFTEEGQLVTALTLGTLTQMVPKLTNAHVSEIKKVLGTKVVTELPRGL